MGKDKYYLRKIRQEWLKKQEFVIISDWGDIEVDLWDALDVYIEAEIEGEDFEDLIVENFPDYEGITDFIEIKAINTVENPLQIQSLIEEYKNCSKKLMFLNGTQQ